MKTEVRPRKLFNIIVTLAACELDDMNSKATSVKPNAGLGPKELTHLVPL